MKFEVIEWNPLYDESKKIFSEIIEIGERINSDKSSELPIEKVFNILFIIDLFYIKKVIKKIHSNSKIVTEINFEIENYYNLPEELFDLNEKNFLEKIIRKHEIIDNFPPNISILFVDQRKKLLGIIKSIFKINDSKISKYSYSILNSCNISTKKLRNGYLYGFKLDFIFSNTENVVLEKNEELKIQPSFPLDLVKTFINAIKQTNIPRILDISKDDTKYGFLAWLNGFNTTIIDTNILKLTHYEVITNQYNTLFSDHLIFPPNDENKLNSIIFINDSLPELKRLKRTNKNTFDGIIANFSFYNLSKDEFYYSIDCLISLLAPNGFILLQDYFKVDEKLNSDIIILPIRKEEFEEYLAENSIQILLRTNDFHLITKTSYILRKKLDQF
ncbi:MAG: hypothetical protein HeimC3_03750 [Candidatus Heimdallarchaeota archaeon LC_3]|nr:MAG: hypothetical protein HeimC3_03750 [Candidatus Heimdallarchaeota archaeon LC_3]